MSQKFKFLLDNGKKNAAGEKVDVGVWDLWQVTCDTQHVKCERKKVI